MASEPPRTDLAAREAAWAAINEVIDPCSRFNGSHLGLVDLGMVKDVSVAERSAKVTLLLDDPICIYTFIIQRDIREALRRHGINDVEISICADELWTADRLSTFAAARLGRGPTSRPSGPAAGDPPRGHGTGRSAERLPTDRRADVGGATPRSGTARQT